MTKTGKQPDERHEITAYDLRMENDAAKINKLMLALSRWVEAKDRCDESPEDDDSLIDDIIKQEANLVATYRKYAAQ